MRKIRSDALWHKLTTAQQSQVQRWFFDDFLSYTQIHQRIHSEFAITCSRSVIGPMYHHCKELRSTERETILQRLSDVITEPGVDLAHIRNETLQVISHRLLDRATAQGNPAEIAALCRVLHKGEMRELEAERVDLMKERLLLRKAMAGLALASSPKSDHAQPANPPLQAARVRDNPG